MDTSETLTGKREQAAVEGVMDSDIPTRSVDKKSRLGRRHLPFVMDKEVTKEYAQWWRSDAQEKVYIQRRRSDSDGPRGVVCVGQWGASVICVGRRIVQPYFGAGIDGGRKACACGPCAKGESEGIIGMGAVPGFLTSEHRRPVQGFCGYAMGADLEGGWWRKNS